MKKLQTAIVAFGKSAQIFHAPLLQAHQGFILRKVLERHGETAKKIYKSIEVVKSLEGLLNDPSIDLVVITTPNQLHFPMAQAALDAGKHVVLEKPFTVTSKEARTLTGLAKSTKRIVSTFQNRRWDSDFLTVEKIVKEGLLGRLVTYEAHFDRFRPGIKDAWKEKREPGAGILYDLGSHLIDQAICLFGLPERIFADIRKQRDGSLVDDYFELILFYRELKVTLKAGMLVKGKKLKYTLSGTSGTFTKYGTDVQEEALKSGALPGSEDWGKEKEADWGTLDTDLSGLMINGRIESSPGNYAKFYDNIYAAITEGKPLAVPPETSYEVIRIIEAAMESHAGQKVIHL